MSVLPVEVAACESVISAVKPVVEVLESSVDVSASRRTLFDHRKNAKRGRKGESVIARYTPLSPHVIGD